jgi:hypothetical protein
MTQRSIQELCFSWQLFMGFAAAGPPACKSANEARLASTAVEVMDFRM